MYNLTIYQVFKIRLKKMSAPVDCPICMDCIDTNKNCVTTECGHCFHASCLMQSVAHNGFGCPYCRTSMAEEPNDSSSEYSDEEEEDEEIFDEDVLRGFRFFWNNLNGTEHDEDDEADEQDFEEDMEEIESNENDNDSSIPSTDFVAQKLRERGVTYEELVKVILHRDHNEYDMDDEQAKRLDGELFGKIRVTILNYEPEQENVVPTPVQEARPITSIQQALPTIDYDAQPKTSNVNRVPRFMIHV